MWAKEARDNGRLRKLLQDTCEQAEARSKEADAATNELNVLQTRIQAIKHAMREVHGIYLAYPETVRNALRTAPPRVWEHHCRAKTLDSVVRALEGDPLSAFSVELAYYPAEADDSDTTGATE